MIQDHNYIYVQSQYKYKNIYNMYRCLRENENKNKNNKVLKCSYKLINVQSVNKSHRPITKFQENVKIV